MNQKAISFLTEPDKEAEIIIRQLESRGDFKFKGISKVFATIQKMTADFWVKNSLPTVDSLARGTEIPPKQIVSYIKEMMKGRMPLVRKLSLIESDPRKNGSRGVPEIASFDVFCRPTAKDEFSAEPYLAEFNRRNHKVLVNYFKKVYKPRDEKQMRQFLLTNIQAGTFPTTYISHVIKELLLSGFEPTPEDENFQMETVVKPIMRQLVNDRVLFFGKNQTNKELCVQNIILVQDKTELKTRFKVLNDYFEERILGKLMQEKIIQESQIQEIFGEEGDELTEAEKFGKVYDLVYPLIEKNPKNIEYQVLSELMIFYPYVAASEKKEKEAHQRQEYESLIGQIREAPRVVDVKAFKLNGKPLKDNIIQRIRSDEQVLTTEYPNRKRVGVFAVHKENVSNVLKAARMSLDVQKNDTEIQILSQMGVRNFLSEKEVAALEDSEMKALAGYLPIFRRLWNMLFGRKPTVEQVQEVKKHLSMETQRELTQARKSEEAERRKQFEKEVAEKVKADEKAAKERKEKLAQASSEGPEGKTEGEGGDGQSDLELEKATLEREEKNREIVDKIEKTIDDAWKSGGVPNRMTIVRAFPEFEEAQILRFMKSHCRGKVRSFKVNYDSEKYKWPVFITARFIKSRGNQLLRQAKEKSDAQRKAQFPNQEEFEYWFALEDFLTRQLGKSK